MSAEAIDFSNADLATLWKDLTDGKSGGSTWVVFGLSDEGRGSAVEPFDQGSGGLAELKQRMKLNTQWALRVLFGAFAVEAIDRRSSSVVSSRRKFVAFSFIGSAVPEIVRAQSSFQTSKILQKLFPATHLTMEVSSRTFGDFTEIEIARRLHNASAAHKPAFYNFFGSAKELSVEEIFKKEEDSDEEFQD